MKVNLEKFDPNKHDKHVVADLIFKSDEEMNTLVYGKDAVNVITQLLTLGDNYFSSAYTECAIIDDRVVGVIVGFPVSEKSMVDNISGKSFAKAMGFFSLIKKIPFFMVLNKIVAGEMDKDGFYIHTICVDSLYQGRGFGKQMIEMKAEEHQKLYLHVNGKNTRAIKFYESVGFVEKFKGTVNYKGQELCESLMEKK